MPSWRPARCSSAASVALYHLPCLCSLRADSYFALHHGLLTPPPHLQPSTLVPTSSSEYRFWPPATPSPRNWRTLRRRVNHQACSWCSSTTTVRSRALLAWGLGIASSLCVLLIDLCVRPAVVLAG